MIKTHYHVIFKFYKERNGDSVTGAVSLDIRGDTVEEAILKAEKISKDNMGLTQYVITSIIEHDHLVKEEEE